MRPDGTHNHLFLHKFFFLPQLMTTLECSESEEISVFCDNVDCNERVDNLLIEWWNSVTTSLHAHTLKRRVMRSVKLRRLRKKKVGTWTVKYYNFFNPLLIFFFKRKMTFCAHFIWNRTITHTGFFFLSLLSNGFVQILPLLMQSKSHFHEIKRTPKNRASIRIRQTVLRWIYKFLNWAYIFIFYPF